MWYKFTSRKWQVHQGTSSTQDACSQASLWLAIKTTYVVLKSSSKCKAAFYASNLQADRPWSPLDQAFVNGIQVDERDRKELDKREPWRSFKIFHARSQTEEMFHQIFEKAKEGTSTTASCCDYISEVMRTIVDYTNCCWSQWWMSSKLRIHKGVEWSEIN